MMRVLHVVGGLGAGGVEQWLVQVMRTIDRDRYRFDFVVHQDVEGLHLAEARSLGARVEVDSAPGRHLGSVGGCIQAAQYVRRLGRILDAGGYDVVHGHQHYFSSLAVVAAARASVPVRIVHSHIDTSPVDRQARLAHRLYLRAARAAILKYSTGQLAANDLAARSLFGSHWRDCRILSYGTDLGRFVKTPDGRRFRDDLGVPPGAWVVGHAGRFVEQKNHRFLLEIAAELARIEPRFHLLLIGDGPLKGEIVTLAAEYGLAERVTFLGTRPDVPELMLNAMDAYVMPSLYEGLPIAVVEAQAAGLPCLVSSTISPSAEAVPALFRQLPLTSTASTWAVELHAFRPTVDSDTALRQVQGGPFNVANSAHALIAFYDEQWARLGAMGQR